MAGISLRCYVCTVDTFSKYACQCGLSDSVESEKDIPVMKSTGFAGICENFFHKILPDDIGEIFRAIGLVQGHTAGV